MRLSHACPPSCKRLRVDTRTAWMARSCLRALELVDDMVGGGGFGGGFGQGMLEWSLGGANLQDNGGGAGGGAMAPGANTPTTLWLSTSYDDLSLGGSSGVDWNGGQYGLHGGVDRRIGDGLVAGIGLSWFQGDFDYSTDAGGAGPVKGSLENRGLSVYPYLGWTPDEKSNLWGTAGFGQGELGVAEDGMDETSGTSQWMAALGGGYRVYESGATQVDVKAEFWTAQFDVEGNGAHISASALGVNRLRLLAEVSRNFEMENGSLAPSVGLAVRQDGGDGLTGGGVELNIGLLYNNGRGFSARADGRHLLSYDLDGTGELGEWGVSGAIILEPGADGFGPSLSLTQTLGEVSGGVGQLWASEALRRARGARGGEMGLRTDARFGYGFDGGARLFKDAAPYVQMSSQAGARHLSLGTRWKAGPMRFEWSLDRREALAEPVHAVELRWQWAPGGGGAAPR